MLLCCLKWQNWLPRPNQLWKYPKGLKPWLNQLLVHCLENQWWVPYRKRIETGWKSIWKWKIGIGVDCLQHQLWQLHHQELLLQWPDTITKYYHLLRMKNLPQWLVLVWSKKKKIKVCIQFHEFFFYISVSAENLFSVKSIVVRVLKPP